MTRRIGNIIDICPRCDGVLSPGCHGAERILRRLVETFEEGGTDALSMHEACQWVVSMDKSDAIRGAAR